MARLTFPDEGSRSSFRTAPNGRPLTSAAGAAALVYLDSGATTLADIQTTAGAAIAGSSLNLDAYSRFPLFLGPADGTDTLYVVVDGGPVSPMYARVDDRIDAVKATADAAETPAGAAAKVSAEATTRAAADSAEATARAAAVTAAQAAAVQRSNHTGTQLAATVSDFSTAVVTAASGAYPAVTGYGPRMVVIGHSIAAGQVDNTTGIFGQSSWPNWLAWLSSGRIRLVRNSAVSGTQAADAISNFATYVTPYRPNVVLIQAFTNDINNGATDAQMKASLDTLIGLVRSIGAQPIVATELPRNDDTTKNQRVREWNYFLKRYCPSVGVRVIDAFRYAVVAATGQMVTAYVANVIHLTTAGAYAVGKGCWTDLSAFFPNEVGVPLPAHQGTLWSDVLLPNGQTNALFLVDGNSDGKADGIGGVSGTATLVSGDTSIIGNWQQAVIASGTNGSIDSRNVAVGLGDATNFPAGDTITVACRFQVPAAVAGSLNWGINVQFLDTNGATVLSTPGGIQNGILEAPDTCAFSWTGVVPANAYYVRLRFQQISGTGTMRLAQMAVVNDSKRAVASL